MAKVQPFFLVVVDQDRDEFTVEGPMTDDTAWTSAVYDAQQSGRNVRCSSGPPDQTRDEAIAEWQKYYSHNLVEAGSIVRPKP